MQTLRHGGREREREGEGGRKGGSNNEPIQKGISALRFSIPVLFLNDAAVMLLSEKKHQRCVLVYAAVKPP